MTYEIWGVIIAVFGVCATGFFFLAKQLWGLRSDMQSEIEQIKIDLKDYVTYPYIREQNNEILVELRKMNAALFGTENRPGIFEAVRNNERRIDNIETKCNIHHAS